VSVAVVGAVLAAAVLHASWNAIAKQVTDRLELFSCMSIAGVVLVAPMLWWVDPPARASWSWLGASVAVHLVYNGGLIAAYRMGDFNQTYPIARGLGPLVVAAVAATVLGEPLSTLPALGVVLIAGAVALLGLVPWRRVRENRPAVVAAALTGLAIAGYTLIDGVGVRRSGSAVGYTVWLLLTHSVATTVAILLVRRVRPQRDAGRRLIGPGSPWAMATVTSVMSMVAYGLVLWAQTQGALAAVAALRESSVVVAAAIGMVFFGEPVGRTRIMASCAVAAGALLLAMPGS